jgi:hypothetical protein
VPQGSESTKGHVHIIKSDDLGEIARALADMLCAGCGEDVMDPVKEDAGNPRFHGLPLCVLETLVRYGFDCAVYEMLTAQSESRLQFKEITPSQQELSDGQV